VTDTAVQQLRDIREQWGDLLTAIATPPAPVWPPVQPSVQHLAAEDDDTPAVGRLPLVLRQHPAPANLDALDAAVSIEVELFALADRLAAAIQRGAWDDDDRRRPDRWRYPTGGDLARRGAPTAPARDDFQPGSRTLGLHWAARWISDRLAQTEPTDLHGIVRGVLRDHAERVTAQAHRTMLAALGRDGRDTVLADPCPWCHGTLTARTTSGDPAAATITCDTGPTCPAPTAYDDRARRTWHGRDLVQLYSALSAARAKETAA
jgi:hypothetical protein